MMNDNRGFAFLGSAIVVALAISIGFGAAVIVERNRYIHQVKLSQQKVNRKSHEQLDLAVTRNSDNTVIAVTNAGSSPAAFDYLLLRQPDNRVVAGPTKWPESLVGWWRFSEGTGVNAYDYSGNGNDGTLKGDPKWDDGRVGDGALEFDGDDDYVEITGFPSIESSISVSAWIKSTVGDRYDASWAGVSRYSQFILGCEGGQMSFIVSTPSDGWTYLRPPTTPNKDEWHHFVGIWEAETGTLQLWMDGELLKEKSYTPDSPRGDSGPIHIGHRECCNNNWMSAAIDDVHIYNRALSPSEISELSSYNVLIDPIGLNPLESYSVTYPYRIGDDVTVGVITHLGNVFWEEW